MKYFSLILSASLLLLGLTSCELDPYIITAEELYTRNFIKRFGLVDEEQNWNQAQSVNVKVNLGSRKAKRVCLYGKHQDRFYLVAELRDVSGLISVPVDVPVTTDQFLAVVDGRNYMGSLNSMIDCTGEPVKASRADVTGMSRGTPIPGQGQLYDPDNFTNGAHTYNVTGVNVSVGLADGSRMRGEALYSEDHSYQLLNAQQISPIVSRGPWYDYYSMNNGWVGQTGTIGLVPENFAENEKVGNTKNTGIVQDFVFEPENGKFTIYPMFYGTNLVHVLGFYLLDDTDQPVCDKDGNPLKFPIYKTKQGYDILVKATSITQIKVMDNTSNYVESVTGSVSTCNVNVSGTDAVSLDVVCLNNGNALTLSEVAGELQIYHDNSHGTMAQLYWDEGNHEFRIKGVKNGTQDIYLYVDNGDGKYSYGSELVEMKLSVNVSNVSVAGLYKMQVNFTDCKGKEFTAIDDNDAEFNQHALTYTPDVSARISLTDINEYPIEIICNDGNLDLAYIFDDIQIYDWSNCFDAYKRNGKLYIKANKDGVDWVHIGYGDTGEGDGIKQAFDIVMEVHVSGITPDGNDTSIFSINPTFGNEAIYWQNKTDGYRMPAINSNGGYITLDGENRTGYGLESSYVITQVNMTNGEFYSLDTASGKLKIQPTSSSQDGTYWVSMTYTKYDGSTAEFVFPFKVDYNASECYMTNQNTGSSGAPRRHNAAKKTSRAASGSTVARSRAQEKPSALNYNANTHWAAINKIWKRTGGTDAAPEGTCDAFPTNNPLLVRTRGYDVTVSGDLYTGKIGLYIDILDNPEIDNKHDCYYTGLYQDASGEYPTFPNSGDASISPFPYTHYSQKSLNARQATVYAVSRYPELAGETFEYSYAATYQHPVSGRLFFSFEDWPVKHAGPNDKSRSGKFGFDYVDNFKWADHTGEYSSDRDLNDLIFVLYGAKAIVSSDETVLLTDDSGFNWIWAVEDLGATDDFDFNDMVMKISVITRNEWNETTDKDGHVTGTETVKFYKKIVFQPLAAGGTLPLYVQWTPQGKSTYYLRPGVYVDSDVENVVGDSEYVNPLDIDNALTSMMETCELHKWFGNNVSTSTMVNTQAPGNPGKRCVIYVPVNGPEYFQIAGFGAGDSDNNLLDASKNTVGLSVYVDDGRTNQLGEYTPGWTVKLPEKGKVSQMFIIHETAEHKWRWPSERSQINESYPDFDSWVENHKIDWVNGRCNGKVIERRD